MPKSILRRVARRVLGPLPEAKRSPLPVGLSDGRVLVDHPVASHMIVDGYCLLVTPRVVMGTYEQAVTAFLRNTVRPNDVVVDIGANQGFHTLTLAMGVLPEGHVYAFEPHPRTFRILSDNVATNFLHHRVTLVEAAAWNVDTTLTFRARTGEAAGSYLREAFTIPGDVAEGEDIQVRAVDIAGFLAGLPRAPSLIKLDAEGSEPQILRAAAAYLAEHRPTVVLEVLRSTFDSADAIDEWEMFLRGLGYGVAYLGSNGEATPVDAGAFRMLTHGAEIVLAAPP